MRYKFRSVLGLSATLLAVTPAIAQAQSHALSPFEDRNESRAIVSLVVPFGQSAEKQETNARLELQMLQIERQGNDFSLYQRPEIISKRSIGFTLDQNPQLAINGQIMPKGSVRSNLSVGEGIAIGGGLFALVTLAFVLDVNDAIDDISDPD